MDIWSFRFGLMTYDQGRPASGSKELTSLRWNACSVNEVVVTLNRQVKGWSNYFDQGRNRPAMRAMNDYIYKRMWKHLSRRSQRGYKPPKDQSWYQHLRHELGVIYL